MDLVKITENNFFTVLIFGNCALLAVMALAGLVFVSSGFAAGMLAGGIIAIINCYWLYFILQRALQLPAQQAVRFTLLRYLLRLILIAVIVSALIIYFKINVFGLLLGLSILVINIMGITIHISTRKEG